MVQDLVCLCVCCVVCSGMCVCAREREKGGNKMAFSVLFRTIKSLCEPEFPNLQQFQLSFGCVSTCFKGIFLCRMVCECVCVFVLCDYLCFHGCVFVVCKYIFICTLCASV